MIIFMNVHVHENSRKYLLKFRKNCVNIVYEKKYFGKHLENTFYEKKISERQPLVRSVADDASIISACAHHKKS